MHITSTLTTLLTAAAVAVASPGGWNGYNGGFCGLTQANINDLITGYTYILTNPGGPQFNATANRILTPDFAVYSDSINSLAGRPLGQPSFQPGRQAFINSQAQTPKIPVVTTVDYFVGGSPPANGKGNWQNVCNNLKLSWRVVFSELGSSKNDVRGILDFDLAPGSAGGDAVAIKTVYAEFNTAAWLQDYGVACNPPPRN